MSLLTYLFIILPLGVLAYAGVSFSHRHFEKKRLLDALDYVLYEITLPQDKLKEGETFKESVASMAKLYVGLSSEKESLSFEIGLPEKGSEIVFFASVPKNHGDLFEKQLQGVFPNAQTRPRKADYNIFKPEGVAVASEAKLKEPYVLPIKTFDKFESDPITLVLNTFSKIKKEGEGAAIQIVMSHANEKKIKHILRAGNAMRSGKSFKKALKGEETIIWGILKGFRHLIFGFPKEPEKPETPDSVKLKLVEEKGLYPVLKTNVRLIASAENEERAKGILGELESAFHQFSDTAGNSLEFKKRTTAEIKDLLFRFSFRIPSNNESIYLNASEIATIFHLPKGVTGAAAPQLKYTKTRESAPPLNLAAHGVLLGDSIYRGETSPVYLSDDDRRRHLYVIGQTGTGKSTMIKNMAVQDIEAGKGVCFIDPHGSDLQDILARVPENRIQDVVYFNPGDIERPMGLNMLEYDPRYPEQKTFVVNELLGIFNKLFDMKTAGGPMFEQYFRNGTLLVMDDVESGNTLFEISRVLSDKTFRDYKLSKTTNPIALAFWRDVAEKAGGEGALQNIVPYITSKFDNFLSNDIMRPIIGQEKSSLNFREIMDAQKILLVNLSKGRLGDLNSSLLGLILVGKLLMASLSRVDMPESERKDFYLYIDEFQNVTTNSIATILSEARKYRLDLTIAHQFIGQLQEDIKKAVFGNVGSMAIFRVGAEDSEFLEKQLTPVFAAQDLMNIDNYNAYVRLLVAGEPARPFNIIAKPFVGGNEEVKEKVIIFSSQKYGRPREEIEAEIRKKYLRE